MDCEHIRELLSARLDRPLPESDRLAVESHLAECATCQAERDALDALHGHLSRSAVGLRAASTRIADRAVERWTRERPAVKPWSQRMRSAAQLVAAAAAGFLLAVVWLQPQAAPQPSVVTHPSVEHGAGVTEVRPAVAARIIAATGPLLYKSEPSAAWQTLPIAHVANFACPASTSLKTEAAALCELESSDGAKVRLNEQTEVTWLAANEVQLVGGELWCRTSSERDLLLKTPDRPAVSWICAAGSECLATASLEKGSRVVALEGTVTCSVNDQLEMLVAGMACQSSANDVVVQRAAEDGLVASRWMQPLMTMAGHGNPELVGRVDSLLARIGRAKVSYLYEQDLRNLGEYGALPLLRFVQSSTAAEDRGRRQIAMRILADIAPVWMIPDLIDLLNDADGQVRSASATALARLTGETQGLSPDDWRSDPAVWTDAVAAWRGWWGRHSFSCPLPPTGVTPRDPAAPPSNAPAILKARG